MRKKGKSMAALAMVFVILSGCGTEIVYSSGSTAGSAAVAVQAESAGGAARGGSGDALSTGTGDSRNTSGTGSEAEHPGAGAEGVSGPDGAALSGTAGRSDKSSLICVYICGEVADPGVYHLKEGARVYEAIEAAGGLLEGADTTHTNQARLLTDGEQITILTEEEAAKLPMATDGTTPNGTGRSDDGQTDSLVNINTADAKQLTTLSGIGETRAEAIIAYRTKNGSFRSIEDIMKVTGIGKSLFEKIKDSITVG